MGCFFKPPIINAPILFYANKHDFLLLCTYTKNEIYSQNVNNLTYITVQDIYYTFRLINIIQG